MAPGTSKYLASWKEETVKNSDGIDEKFDWLTPVPGDSSKVKCSLCVASKPFSIATQGFSAVRQHANGTGHRKLVKEKTQKIQTTLLTGNGGSSSLCFSAADMVTNAEILRALDIVECNQSFASAASDKHLYQRMFPNDPIAKQYQMGETKVSYIIKYGISPYMKRLILKDVVARPFSFKFDETTTSQVKKQYDGYITYCSPTVGRVITVFMGSLFVGHCKDQDLLDHFYAFMKDFELDTDYCLALGMDGPNVNKSFERKLRKDLKSNFNVSMLDLGTCPLHIVNNSYGAGIEVLRQSGVNIETFFNDVYFFFKLSSARREDYKEMETITDVTAQFMMKYSSTRWLYIGKVAVRVLEQYENLKEYFLVTLPQTKGFNYKNGVGNTERYIRIKSALEADLTPVILAFVAYTTNLYSPFVLLLQREEPLIHILHTQMKKLMHDILTNVLEKSFLASCMSNGKEITLDSLNKLDFSHLDKKHLKAQAVVGSKAKNLLDKLDSLTKKQFFENTIHPFYKSCIEYLLNNLPLNKQLLVDVKCLHPLLRKRIRSLEAISRLAKEVIDALGDAMHTVFSVKKETTVDQLVDIITAEFRVYQIEDIPDNMIYDPENLTRREQVSYWKYAYGIAGIEKEDRDNYRFKRIDEYWTLVSKLIDPTTGVSNYKNLYTLAVHCVFVIPHGNAEPERGFSINKHLLSIHGNSTKEDTLVALRFVKDGLIRIGGLKNFVVTKDLIKCCREARNKYEESLRMEREKKAADAKKERDQAAAAAAAAAKGEGNKKLNEVIRQHRIDIQTLQTDIKATETLAKEGNKEISAQLMTKSKVLDGSKLKISQTKIDMALKRKDELAAEVKSIEKKIGVAEKKLKK